MSIVRIVEVFSKETDMRILLGHRKLSVIERSPYGDVRLYISISRVFLLLMFHEV